MKNIFEIFYRFFTLGLISFGGPMAHIGYFRNTFVKQLQWIDETTYSKLLALSNFLPGPSSSQVGFTIGLKRGGVLGAITAFVAFTLPSFILLYFIATFTLTDNENSIIQGAILGLKLFAVVIVADATLSMFKNFCKDKTTIAIFAFASLLLIIFPSAYIQILVLILCAILGKIFIKNTQEEEKVEIKKTKKIPLLIFLFLLFIFPLFINEQIELKLFQAFYEVGSLVFGGGHVVLPLLEQNLASYVSKEEFLVAYSLAQAVPGPMFTIASYLGADILKQSAFLGALITTIAIFLPGFLLILAFYESFESYSKKASVRSILAGVNAAVVGLLFSVLLVSVAPSAIYSIFDVILVLAGLYVIRNYKISILYTILFFIVLGILKSIF